MRSITAFVLLAAVEASPLLPRQSVAYTGTYSLSSFFFGGSDASSTTSYSFNVSSSSGGTARCSLTQSGRTIERFSNTFCETTKVTNPNAQDSWLFSLFSQPNGSNPNNFTFNIFHSYFNADRTKLFDEVGSLGFDDGDLLVVSDSTAPGVTFEVIQVPSEFELDFVAEDISEGNIPVGS